MMRRLVVLLAGTLALLAPGSSWAQERVHALAHDTPRDLALTFSIGAALGTTESLKAELAPAQCRWCARDATGHDTLNPIDRAVRRALVWNDRGLAIVASNVAAFGLLPVSTIGANAIAADHESAFRGVSTDTMIAVETTLIATALTQATKLAFGRERPFVHFRDERVDPVPAGLDERFLPTADDNVSFYSGHTSAAFAFAASSGTVASLRGYSFAPIVWATGLSLATLVGYLRIAADKHYFTDVLTGAILGSAIGIGAPLLLHGREP